MSSNTTIQFSPREMEVLALAWQCMEAQPKIDMAKLASLTGYRIASSQTPGSASVTFGNIKRKLKLLGEGLAADGPATPKKGGGPGRAKAASTPRSAGKRNRKSEDGEESQSKKAKEGAARKPHNDSDEDDELSVPRIKKEELTDVTNGASDFFDQLQNAAGQYDFERNDLEDD
ncbi:hypothetical protein IQ06DRAFT_332238 [Phaeosphaeriaceae sp. SRC1lsM3a]|nr:hypothetical protein IQ06DRAFT_332238 [Stagonospora sp. SRC1lsM3a]